MNRVISLSIAILVILNTPTQAETHVVPDDYATIQQAIDDSNDGDVIIVDPGTYSENINFSGKNIVLTSADPNNPEIVAATVIDGEKKGSVVSFVNGESSKAVLAGFTITGGYGTQAEVLGENILWGGGVFCHNASPTIISNVITGNNCPFEMTVDGSEQSAVCYGAGVGCIDSGGIISRNTIKNNSAFAGAGIMTYNGDAKIANNLIYDNSAVYGGGVVLFGGQLINNTIAGNDASLSEDGIAGNVYLINSSQFNPIRISNNIISDAKSGGGIFIEDNTNDSVITFNNVWGNKPGNYFGRDPNTGESIFDGPADRTGRVGNISENPLFGNNYHIDFASVCRDAGDPNYTAYPWQRDIDGEYAVMGERVDIGADEVTANPRPVADAGSDQFFDVLNDRIVLDGTGSRNLDASGTLYYQWRQNGGPTVDLADPNASKPDFVPVIEDVYFFELTVSDGHNHSAPDIVMIVVGNRTPVADAGQDRTYEVGESVVLDGSGSYDPDRDDVLSYSWTQISGAAVELLDANNPSARFTPQAEGEYVFELIVNDSSDQSLPDTIIISCWFGSMPDEYGYRWIDSDSPYGPKYHWIDIQQTGIEINGLENSFEESVGPFLLGFNFEFYGSTYDHFYVQSNGLISFDSAPVTYNNRQIPAADGYDNIIAWMWTYMNPTSSSKIYYQQFANRTVVQFVDYTMGWGGSVNAEVILYESGIIVIQYKDFSEDAYLYSYTIGIENADGTVGTQVAFNDSYYLHDELAVEISFGPPYEPVADAGSDQYLDRIELVTLDGTGSNDRDPCDVLTYQWTQIAGPAAQLSDFTAVQPTFMPESESEYWFRLVVSDGIETSAPDEVLIVVGNRAPVADTGPTIVVQVPGRVNLDGTGSFDPDLNDELTYIWTQLEGQPVVLEDANTATPSFDCSEEGSYVFELIVSDGLAESKPSVTQITTVVVTLNRLDLDVGFNTNHYFHYPDVSGQTVVYGVGSACDYTWNIKCKDMETRQVQSFSGGGIDTQPKIDGDILVWFGGPKWGNPWYHEPSNASIFVRNISTGSQQTLRHYSMSKSYSHPVVSGNKVVWLEHLNLDPNPPGNEANSWWNTPYNICGADITNLESPRYFTIALDVGNRDPYPCHSYSSDFDDVIDICGDIVVYEAGGDIYGADISKSRYTTVFTICSDSARQFDPAISGNIVVWTDERNDAGDIYGADISDMNNIREIEIIKEPGSQQQPAIDERAIVYVDTYDNQIKICCLTRKYGVLDIKLENPIFGLGPAIDGQTIVWQTASYGEADGVSLQFGYSIADGPVENLNTGKHYDYIQHAVDNAESGHEIVVGPGTYNESINFKGKKLTVSSSNPDDPAIVAATVIKGRGRIATFENGEDTNSILSGFTITGGGNGIYCTEAAPTITNCIITGNINAGIMLYSGGNPTITNCDIVANYGAGIEMHPRKSARSTFFNYPQISNSIIAKNTLQGIFGGVPTITNCTIANNFMDGIYGSRPTVTNSIIYFNGSAQITESVATVTYTNVQGLWPGLGNIDFDPLFADCINLNYHLQSQAGRWDPDSQTWIQDNLTSPCIDKGDPASHVGDEPAPNGDIINMGAYGGTAQASMTFSD